jgi:hypothetical protein
MADARPERSLGELFAELSRETGTLIRQEVALARVELTQKATVAGQRLGRVVVGGALAYAGLLVVLAAIVLILVRVGLPAWAASLIVGVLVIAIGGLMARTALAALGQGDLAPTETIRSMKENAEWAKHPTK